MGNLFSKSTPPGPSSSLFSPSSPPPSKKARLSNSPSYDHQLDKNGLIPSLVALPDLVHDAITSLVNEKDMHRMMETSQWGVEVYGGRITKVEIKRRCNSSARFISFMAHRRGVVHVVVKEASLMRRLGEAMRHGACDQLKTLQVEMGRQRLQHMDVFPVCRALSKGACPQFTGFITDSDLYDEAAVALADALRTKMATTGWRGLKLLDTIDEKGLLISRLMDFHACEELEALRCSIESTDSKVSNMVEQPLLSWLSRSSASHLRVLSLSGPSEAFSHVWDGFSARFMPPGMAPNLRVLRLCFACRLSDLARGLRERTWPHLEELRVVSYSRMADVVTAIGEGGVDLKSLSILVNSTDEEAWFALARMLSDGGCPRLEELEIDNIDGRAQAGGQHHHGAAEVRKALEEGGAPCAATLRRWNGFYFSRVRDT